jgi:outer membrane protein assembly factor BamB
MKNYFITVICVFMVECLPIKITYAGNDPLVWKFKTNGGINSAPIVDDSIVYFGSNDQYFYAINKVSGAQIWRFKTEHEVNSKATVNDSLVFFESGFRLYALDKLTGELAWSFVANDGSPEMSVGFTDYHHCSPVLYNNNVFYGDGWGNMNGLDIRKGNLVFQYTITGDSVAIRSTPAIKDDIIYFGSWAGNAYAVSLIDSTLKWKYSLPGRKPYYGMITSEMVIKDSILYFGSQHDVYTPININTGKAAWKFTDPNQTYLPSGPVFYDDAVIVGTTINTWKIYSLTNGNINWTFNTDGVLFVTPALVDTILIMNTSNFGGGGTMYMINVKNGEWINEYHFSIAAPSSPTVSDGKLYVGNGDGYLYSLYLNNMIIAADDTTITIDTTTAEYNYADNDKIKFISLVVQNKGIICDDYLLTYSMSENTPEDGINYVTPNSTHVWAQSKNSTLFTVNPQKLNPGNYTINISISSKKLPEVVFHKTLHINISPASGTKSINNDTSPVSFYPNPARDFVTIDVADFMEIVQVTIYDLAGKVIYSEVVKSGKTNWNLNDISNHRCRAGEYIYRVKFGASEKSGLISIL